MPPNRNKYRYGHGDRYRNAHKTGIGTDAVTGIEIVIGMYVVQGFGCILSRNRKGYQHLSDGYLNVHCDVYQPGIIRTSPEARLLCVF